MGLLQWLTSVMHSLSLSLGQRSSAKTNPKRAANTKEIFINKKYEV